MDLMKQEDEGFEVYIMTENALRSQSTSLESKNGLPNYA